MNSRFVGTRSFRRFLQWDDYSCGARSVQMVLRHFGRAVPYRDLLRALRTNADVGTTVAPMLKVLRRHRLRVGYRPRMTFRELLGALGHEAVVIVHVDGDHLAVVHGADKEHVWLADPALGRMLGRRISKERFLRARWTRWGLVVRSPSTQLAK